MRNKLLFVVATNPLFLSRSVSKDLSEPYKQKCKKTNLSFMLILALFLLLSGKGFAQLSESFESGVPNTWTLFGNGVGTSEWSQTTDGYLGTNAVSINPSADDIGNENTAQYFLVTPQIAVPENGEIHFYTKQSSEVDNGAQYQVRISTASQPDINGFNVVLQTYTEADLNTGAQTNYEKKVIEIPTSIPAGLNVYIAFVAVNTQNGLTPTGDEWFVDEVAVLEGCTEIDDTSVIIDNITVDSAEVAWTHPTATNFEIQILPEGGTPASSGISVTGSSYTLMNLDPDTAFDVYISAICDNDTQSNWTGPYTFNTLKYGLSCDFPITVPDVLNTGTYTLVDNLMNYNNPDVTYTTAGSNCISESSTNYLNGDKAFLSYTATEDALLTITQTVAGYDPSNPLGDCYNSNTAVLVYQSCADVGVSCMAGINTTSGTLQNQIQNLLVQAGETYIIVVSSDLSPEAGICFQLEIEGSTCAAPSGISYDDLTDTSVSMSWDNVGGFADTWEYIVVPTGSGEPTGSGAPTTTNTGNVINSGLDAGLTYDFYVRSVCDGAPGEWSNAYTFTMQCSVFDTPYTTDFETASSENPEPCWTILDVNHDGIKWKFNFGVASMKINDFSAGNLNNNNDILVSPMVHLDGVIQKRLRFKYNSYQGTTVYAIKLSTTGVGADNFTTVLLPETEVSDLGWQNYQELIVNIPEAITGDINIAWVIEPNAIESANTFSIDDVFIEDKPACPDPLSPTVDNVTTTTADLYWNQGDVETQWQVVIQDENSGEPVDDSNAMLVDTNNPYMATDLLPAHRYEYYVRAYCNDLEQSQWVGPIPFITECDTFGIPFFESFNDDDYDTQKFCWSIIDANADEALWIMNENEPSIQGSSSWFNPTTGYDDWLISPAINVNVDGIYELKFDYRAQFSFFHPTSRYGLEVLISTTDTDPSSFTVIEPLFDFVNTDYQEKSTYFEASGTIYIAFRVPPEFSIDEGTSVLNIDNVSIINAPDCPAPSEIQVSSITQNSAEVAWSAGFQEENWNIVVQPAGTGLPTDTTGTSSITNFSATDLLSETEYEVYVQASCDTDSNSTWAGPVTFTTLCNAFPTPFLETFESNSTSEGCWRVFDENEDDTAWLLDITMHPYEGQESASIFSGNNGDNDDWLISPTITITENQRLRYYYRVDDGFFSEDLEVLLSTNGIELDQFTTVLYDSATDPVLINNEVYFEKTIDFPAGIMGDVNIAFHVPFYPPAPEGYRGQTIFIDNFIVEDIPSCPEASNVVVSNVTDTQIDIDWGISGTAATEWEIAILPYELDAPVGDVDPEYLYQTSAPPFTATDLTPATKYNVYVRALCGDTETSGWSPAVEFTTKCSFENLCAYTVILTSDNSSGVGGGIDVIQNEVVQQTLEFPSGPFGEVPEPAEYQILLCTGIEFSLFWDSIGTAPDQYPNAQVELQDYEGNTVWTSPLGIGTPRTTLYTGVSICGDVACPQPTDLTASSTSVLSWTPGGTETQWEVAIQPIDNGTIPQTGTIVDTNSYTPTTSDFLYENAATYEYFVRAVCGTDDTSYWSGPYAFVRNDDVSTALTLPINDTEFCGESAIDVTFRNVSVSPETMNCDGDNEGDVWFEFIATSRVHIIEVNGYTGNYYVSSGDELYPDLTMTLYHELTDNNLEELTCSKDNTIVASYASELVIGDTYKVRLTLHTPVNSTRTFNVCVTTPEDICQINAVNYDFERPVMTLNAIQSILQQQVVPGWRTNLTTWNAMLIWNSLVSLNYTAYSGSQCVQLLTDPDATETDINGLYKDFDSSEITLFDYSFALSTRSDGNIVQLYAGPLEGPFELIHEELAQTSVWVLQTGTYQVPEGQTTTRFLFKSKDNRIGTLIDAANFVANNQIITESYEIDCNEAIANVEANGVGMWIANENNPGVVTITDANSSSTTITGFVEPGIYTFTWKTRYCENDIEITYSGIADLPNIETPVEYCLNNNATPLTATATGSYTLVWYTQASGGVGSTTAPTPDTTTSGSTSYYVANADENGCEGPRAEIVVNVNDTTTPELTFSYETVCIVTSENQLPILNSGFATGGEFTSTTLTVDATTGEIDIASATAGQHDVVYTFTGDPETCTLSGTYTATIEFTAASNSVTTFDYGETEYCVLSENILTPNLAVGFTTGGVFSSTTINVDATTGEIDLATAAVGMHDIVYTYNGDDVNCIQESTFTVSIEILESEIAVTDFTYAEDLYCADSGSVMPELATGFTSGGVFSAEPGLTIDATTGEINISSSSLGNYTVTYETAEDEANCIESSTSVFMITVLDAIEVSVDGACNGSEYWLTASPVGNSYDPNDVIYTWKDADGNVVGQDSETFNVTAYTLQNSSITVPAQFTVTVTFGGCSSTTSFTTNTLSCNDIPRGISPDGNGKNDTFDLSGFDVVDLKVFSRHGKKVYNFSGTYTNQWYGQSNKGNDLPDGTYFYNIAKKDGSTVTGWVYINRSH